MADQQTGTDTASAFLPSILFHLIYFNLDKYIVYVLQVIFTGHLISGQNRVYTKDNLLVNLFIHIQSYVLCVDVQETSFYEQSEGHILSADVSPSQSQSLFIGLDIVLFSKEWDPLGILNIFHPSFCQWAQVIAQ